MLPKKFRLRKTADIKNSIRRARKLVSEHFKFYVHVRDEDEVFESPRFGFILPKKISKAASKRNRARRRVAEIIYNLITKDKKFKLEHKDIIFYFKDVLIISKNPEDKMSKKIVEVSKSDLQKEVQKLLKFASSV